MRRKIQLFAVHVAFTLGLALPAQAQVTEWNRLIAEWKLLSSQSSSAQRVMVAEQLVPVAEKTFGPEHSSLAWSLHNLASLYQAQGRYADAEPLCKRTLAIREKVLGPDHPDVATSLNALANAYIKQGKFGEVEPLLTRGLAINEKALGPEDPGVAAELGNLAWLHLTLGRGAKAEPLLKRALAIYEKSFGPEHREVTNTLNSLANAYQSQGKYSEAESLLKRALAINERVLGLDHPEVATGLNSLAYLYYVQGKYEESIPLFKRSVAIREKAFGPDHPLVATAISNLASSYGHQGQYAQAEALDNRALAIREKALGPDHPDVAISLNALAVLYFAQDKFEQAEPLYKRVSVINEKRNGPDHPRLAADLSNLALLYKAQGKFAQVEQLLKRVVTIDEKNLGPDHPVLASDLNTLADFYYDQGQYANALPLARRASVIYRQRIVSGGTSGQATSEASHNSSGFNTHLLLLARNPLKEGADKIADESFQITQLEQTSGTAAAISKMAARFASGNDAMAVMIKRKQDASDQRAQDEAQQVKALSKPPQERNAANEKALRENIVRLAKDVDGVDAELTRRFPEYQELTRPEPVSVSQIQALLRPTEAMLVYALKDSKSKSSYVWVVRKDNAKFLRIEVDFKTLTANVATVRAEMDFDGSGNAIAANVGILHQIYQDIFAPALPHLAGIKHVMVVPTGQLQSLPFSMLVASAPPAIKTDADYRKVSWLIRHYALSVLPSVSSLQAFRRFVKAPGVQEPFAGFGDPLIGNAGGATRTVTRGKRGKVDIASVFRNLAVSSTASGATSNPSAEIADVETLRIQARLPETADELLSMAKTLHSDAKSLWLRENATETQVKKMDLSKYRTLAFATHGVMAGQVKGAGEPGLILTPPKVGTLEDDGYLSSGEIAKLKLNADWVVLSACNTAAADGTTGAEGFSGLAKAFFYAGARSLLVSHWPVVSEATVPLNAGMMKEYGAHPELGKSEAQRKAILALIDTPDHPEYAHPLFWAPFVVVGEGGAGSTVKSGGSPR